MSPATVRSALQICVFAGGSAYRGETGEAQTTRETPLLRRVDLDFEQVVKELGVALLLALARTARRPGPPEKLAQRDLHSLVGRAARRRNRLDCEQTAALMLDLERRVVDFEPSVQQLCEGPADLVAMGVDVGEDVR